jgi:hypothetical protein
MVSMSDEPKERNILKLILIVGFACATLDVRYPIVQVLDVKATPMKGSTRFNRTLFSGNIHLVDLFHHITRFGLYFMRFGDFVKTVFKKKMWNAELMQKEWEAAILFSAGAGQAHLQSNASVSSK